MSVARHKTAIPCTSWHVPLDEPLPTRFVVRTFVSSKPVGPGR